MKAQSLKNAILQLAVQGKLVPQNPQDEPASELLKKIKAEKAILIREKKIKSEKPLAAITDEEKPFDIPDSWEWVRLGTICTLNPRNAIDDSTSVSFIPMSLIDDGYRNSFTFETRLWKDIKSGFTHFSEGDIGVAKIIPCFDNRKSAIFVNLVNGFGAGTTELHIVRVIKGTLLHNYVLWFLKTHYFINSGIKTYSGTAGQQRISKSFMENVLFPLPPLAEQKRIVEKIEQLMPLVERYGSYEKELSVLETKFPSDLKKSVLQFAVQGKLVPQDDTDEPASELLKRIKSEKAKLIREKKIKAEKPLAEITDEEKPFNIPDSWEWVRLNELCAYIQRGKSPKYSDVRKIPVIAQKCNQWDGFSIEKAKFIDPDSINGYVEERMLQDSDLMWNSTGIGTLGRIAMYETRLNPYSVAVADSHVTVIRPFRGFVLSVYLLKYFSSPFVQNVIEDKSEGSTKQKELSTSTIKNYIVPIPPLAEQQRIVEKVEQLLALCDVLADENKLKQYQPPKRLANVIEFTPVETAEEHEHLFAARANEISPETRIKEQERLALLRKKR